LNLILPHPERTDWILRERSNQKQREREMSIAPRLKPTGVAMDETDLLFMMYTSPKTEESTPGTQPERLNGFGRPERLAGSVGEL